jgi:hypothetical protein
MTTQVIPLSGMEVALVSAEDYARLAVHRWSVHARRVRGRTVYASRKTGIGNGKIFMHREVLSDIPIGQEVDHINGNGLDNRRENLRLVNRSVNKQNGPAYRGSVSRFKGVTLKRYHSGNTAWEARIRKDGHLFGLGRFASEEQAARAYDSAALEMYGPLAFVNFRSRQEGEAK